jgi:hypothetical protein
MDKIRTNYNDDTIASGPPVKRSTLRAGVPFVLDAELLFGLAQAQRCSSGIAV